MEKHTYFHAAFPSQPIAEDELYSNYSNAIKEEKIAMSNISVLFIGKNWPLWIGNKYAFIYEPAGY